MKGIVARSLGLSVVLAASAVTLVAGEALKAKTGIPLNTDWSSRHMIFSHPQTPEQAARLNGNIRYLQQMQRHTVRQELVERRERWRIRWLRRHRAVKLHRDWSWDMGPGATVGEGRFPAKYSFSSTTANCAASGNPDFVVFPTNKGSGTSIGALQNIYTGCGGQVPASYWAYNTGATVNTSPVISFDGTQVAFTQTNGTTASLVLLRWTSGGTFAAPQSPTSELNGSYLGCTAPCMTTFSLGANDTNSSVYYDYGTDVAFVGDDAGFVHQYTGVFKSTPTEVGSPWPVKVGSNKLTSAVFDPSNATVYVGDSGGILYSITSSGSVTASSQLDFGTGLTEGPVIDAGIGVVYAFSSKDFGGANAGVYQLPTGFTGGATGTEAVVGAATAASTPLYNGGFNHDYIMSANSTGKMFVCGNPGGVPTLYGIPIVGGVMGTPVAGAALSTTSENKCSPVTDTFNPSVTGAGLPEEWVFVSVHAAGTPSACVGVACVMNFRTTPWEPSTTYANGQLILDSNMNIEVVDSSGSGLSGTTEPVWPVTVYSPPTSDGAIHWRNQGPLVSNPANGGWTANTLFPGSFEIIDSHNNIEIAEPTGGTSGGTTPAWAIGEGQTTPDGGVTWINLGANPVAGLGANGGTSGIVIDNTANLPGASQVYYSNLQDTGCPTSGGTGGCAVQASQQALQ